jgi:hypothetical protein
VWKKSISKEMNDDNDLLKFAWHDQTFGLASRH